VTSHQVECKSIHSLPPRLSREPAKLSAPESVSKPTLAAIISAGVGAKRRMTREQFEARIAELEAQIERSPGRPKTIRTLPPSKNRKPNRARPQQSKRGAKQEHQGRGRRDSPFLYLPQEIPRLYPPQTLSCGNRTPPLHESPGARFGASGVQ